MTDIYSVRRENLRRLIGDEPGSMSKLAATASMSKQQVSHYIGRNPIKNIGHQAARHFEQVLGVPIGTLDSMAPQAKVAGDRVDLPLLFQHVGPRPQGRNEVLSLAFTRRWITSNIGIAPESAAIYQVRGDRMEPTLSDGDIALVDTSDTSVDADGVYVITQEDADFAARAARVGGGISLSFDNGAYQHITFKARERKDLVFHGRVLMVLRPSRL